jgi:hypothetical protein
MKSPLTQVIEYLQEQRKGILKDFEGNEAEGEARLDVNFKAEIFARSLLAEEKERDEKLRQEGFDSAPDMFGETL